MSTHEFQHSIGYEVKILLVALFLLAALSRSPEFGRRLDA